jgi:hypothetical protein
LVDLAVAVVASKEIVVVATDVVMITTDAVMIFTAEVVATVEAPDTEETDMMIVAMQAMTAATEIVGTTVALTNMALPAKSDMVETIATVDERNVVVAEAEAEVTMAARIVVMALTISRPPERVVMPILEVVVTTTVVMNATLAEEWFR